MFQFQHQCDWGPSPMSPVSSSALKSATPIQNTHLLVIVHITALITSFMMRVVSGMDVSECTECMLAFWGLRLCFHAGTVRLHMHAGSLKLHTHAGSLKMHICPGSLMLYRGFCIETEFQCDIHSAAFIKLLLVPKIIFTGNFNLCLYPINITSHSSSFVALCIWDMAAQFMDPFLYPIPDNIRNIRNLLPIAVCCFTIWYYSWLSCLCKIFVWILASSFFLWNVCSSGFQFNFFIRSWW